MARYTGPVCRLCRRERMKLFLKGAKCDTDEVPDRAAPVPARRGRPRPPAPGLRVPAPAPREAEGPPHLRPHGEAVPPRLRRGEPPPGRHRREPAADARAPPRQRRLPRRVGREPGPGPPARPPRPRRRERQAGHDPQLPGPQGRRRLAAREGQGDDRRPPQPRHPRPADAAVAGGRRRRFQVTVRDLPHREAIDVPVREQLIVELYSK